MSKSEINQNPDQKSCLNSCLNPDPKIRDKPRNPQILPPLMRVVMTKRKKKKNVT